MKVVILGCAPRALEHPADAEVWVVNGPRLPLRWDRLFQLHGLDHIAHKHPELLLALREFGTPHGMGCDWETGRRRRLFMTQEHAAIPAAERFPIERVKAAAGDYLTNSFPMLIAFAVLEGATEIILDGVMWAGGPAQWGAGEGWAVPCVEYHIGRAEGLGVKVTVPPGCGLFAHREFIYGFEGPGSV